MALNFTKSTDREKLTNTIRASRQIFDGEYGRYARLVKKYVGSHRGRNAQLDGPPIVNKLQEAGSADTLLLAGGRPQFKVTSKRPSYAPFSKLLQLHVNELSDEIYLQDTLGAAVLASFFKLGILHSYRADSAMVALGGDNFADPGRPFIGYVSFEDYLHDCGVSSLSKLSFQLHYYDVVWERLRDSDLFDSAVADKIRPNKDDGYRYDAMKPSSAKEAFGTMGHKSARIEEEVRLVDVYFPREKKIVTWPWRIDSPPLRVMDYDGPECGPYKLVKFDDVPDNTLPVSSAENLEALHDLLNRIWRKKDVLTAQERDVGIFEPSAAEDAEALRTAKHGQWKQVKRIAGVDVKHFGGVNQNISALAAIVDEVFDRRAGNLKQKLGLGTDEPTAEQSQMVGSSVNANIAKRQQRVMEAAAWCGSELSRMLFDDKVMTREGWMEDPRVPGVKVPAHWFPDHRQGTPHDYAWEIVPYSMSFRTPQQRVNDMLGNLQRLMPFAQAAQKRPNFEKILQDVAEAYDQPGLLEWFDDMSEDDMQGAGPDEAAPAFKQSVTTRKSEAKSGGRMQELVGGMSPAGAAG